MKTGLDTFTYPSTTQSLALRSKEHDSTDESLGEGPVWHGRVGGYQMRISGSPNKTPVMVTTREIHLSCSLPGSPPICHTLSQQTLSGAQRCVQDTVENPGISQTFQRLLILPRAQSGSLASEAEREQRQVLCKYNQCEITLKVKSTINAQVCLLQGQWQRASTRLGFPARCSLCQWPWRCRWEGLVAH